MNELKNQYNQLLENIASSLDISPSKYQQAVARYKSIGEWLHDGIYPVTNDGIDVYTQGSFRLGTVVRPLKDGKESDYDIDLISFFKTEKNNIQPKILKSIVGDRIKENATYSQMLDKEGRRCWTLNYAEEDGIGFHVDILPSVPENKEIILMLLSSGVDNNTANKTIALSHKAEDKTYSWTSSNPKGYADWFEVKNKPALDRAKLLQKKALFENNRRVFASIDDVPDALVKTPLQRAIQILKRHRDYRFISNGDEEDKPISMIITTLSAQIYSQENDVLSTLSNIVSGLSTYTRLFEYDSVNGSHSLIFKRNGKWYIPNPVNPAENFADRWHENNHKKAKAFFQWVSWLQSDIIDILSLQDIRQVGLKLEERFDKSLIKKASAGLPFLSAYNATSVSKPHIVIEKPNKPWGTLH